MLFSVRRGRNRGSQHNSRFKLSGRGSPGEREVFIVLRRLSLRD